MATSTFIFGSSNSTPPNSVAFLSACCTASAAAICNSPRIAVLVWPAACVRTARVTTAFTPTRGAMTSTPLPKAPSTPARSARDVSSVSVSRPFSLDSDTETHDPSPISKVPEISLSLPGVGCGFGAASFLTSGRSRPSVSALAAVSLIASPTISSSCMILFLPAGRWPSALWSGCACDPVLGRSCSGRRERETATEAFILEPPRASTSTCASVG
mmetsp:Transcript_7604/g.17463  ORF Transcript_7604/g.17463 Transcript_7604/m.17463 type:complete len:215 (-) Transcript_7604:1643-2287(-)